MKKICIVTDSPKTHSQLKPVIDAIRQDKDMELTQLDFDHHKSRDIRLTAAWENGKGRASQSLDIRLPSEGEQKGEGFPDQAYFSGALGRINPDILMVWGNSHISFSAAIAASLANIPLAHIHGGEADYGLWDDTLGFGITKMAHLHFTACETYRRRIIGSGEHPDRVFNVGALSPGYLWKGIMPGKARFYQAVNLDPSREFLFLSITPDRALGSKNEILAASLMNAMEAPRFNRFSLVCQDPGPRGFGRIMKRQMDAAASRRPERIRFITDETYLPAALVHCRAMIGNTDTCVAEAASVKTGVVSLGNRLKDRDNPGHMIYADMDTKAIADAVETVLDPLFQVRLMFRESPFEKQDTPGRIKKILKTFGPEDILSKSYCRK